MALGHIPRCPTVHQSPGVRPLTRPFPEVAGHRQGTAVLQKAWPFPWCLAFSGGLRPGDSQFEKLPSIWT